MTTMAYNDRRALTLLVFHALRKAVETFDTDQEPNDMQIQEIILTVISLLPRMGAKKTENVGRVHLQWLELDDEKQSTEYGDVILDIQPIIDSIRIVWRDYLKLLEKPQKF